MHRDRLSSHLLIDIELLLQSGDDYRQVFLFHLHSIDVKHKYRWEDILECCEICRTPWSTSHTRLVYLISFQGPNTYSLWVQHCLTLREYLNSNSMSTINILADTNVCLGVIYFCPLNTFTCNTSTNFLVPSALSGINSLTVKTGEWTKCRQCDFFCLAELSRWKASLRDKSSVVFIHLESLENCFWCL